MYISHYSVKQYFVVSGQTATPQYWQPEIQVDKYIYGQPGGPHSLDIGPVFLNGKQLPVIQQYSATVCNCDTVSQIINPPFTWNVDGSNEYPPFSEHVLDSFPVCLSCTLMPDTIIKSGTATVPISVRLGSLSAVYIQDGTSSDPNYWFYFSFHGAGAPVAINTPTYLNATNSGTLNLEFSQRHYRDVGEFGMTFETKSVYRKKIVIRD